jgi:hypothetical protein
LSFAEERIGPLAAIVATVFYLLALYLFALSNTPENPFDSIYSETWIKTTSQHLLLLVGFDTLIYQKYYDTPPILVGHQRTLRPLLPRLALEPKPTPTAARRLHKQLTQRTQRGNGAMAPPPHGPTSWT